MHTGKLDNQIQNKYDATGAYSFKLVEIMLIIFSIGRSR